MIAKGNTHNNGVKLAQYLMDQRRQTAVLYQLEGFIEDTNIERAFQSVNVMAEGTYGERPFFHLQVRLCYNDRRLPPKQWLYVADYLGDALGLKDQPRAIVFHKDHVTRHQHMHVGYSRVKFNDQNQLILAPLPYSNYTLKEACRQLEVELGLIPVTNERSGKTMAPTRKETEQARRLGVDWRSIRETIRGLWEMSCNGVSFATSLFNKGYLLARGDKRDFVVVDRKGGVHSLGKKVLGVSAAEARARMGDLRPEDFASVASARKTLEYMASKEKKKGGQSERFPSRVKKQKRNSRGREDDILQGHSLRSSPHSTKRSSQKRHDRDSDGSNQKKRHSRKLGSRPLDSHDKTRFSQTKGRQFMKKRQKDDERDYFDVMDVSLQAVRPERSTSKGYAPERPI